MDCKGHGTFHVSNVRNFNPAHLVEDNKHRQYQRWDQAKAYRQGCLQRSAFLCLRCIDFISLHGIPDSLCLYANLRSNKAWYLAIIRILRTCHLTRSLSSRASASSSCSESAWGHDTMGSLQSCLRYHVFCVDQYNEPLRFHRLLCSLRCVLVHIK